ncbi:DUF72 domain-containing protein [Qingshengfaniella alkalisoli]|uniref:DUF72 domain-containing protein n=1 Tax=Qingshengfaniella alkalisoli TaxID=2599296 RepID=A0A5B8IQ97_9RHOB|nr:DUF72 domain-containing protein [Qingshengfaniella alkalisoli]QDY68422.1 DUF72 domain-containing protein [Qingshengfaniella alkalisoli]
MTAGRIRIGIGGWTFKPWRGSFYPDDLPQRRELEYASGHLGTIEINGTYYGSQKPETFKKWHDETPDDFVFSVKGPRFATNRKALADGRDSVERFLTSGVTELGRKLGPILWQFMATKKFDPEDFEGFLDLLPEKQDDLSLRHVVEVRHDSFCCDEFVALARKHGVAVASAFDSPHPKIEDVTADFAYLRIMGTKENEPLGYPADALGGWADKLRELAEGRDVFAYIIGGYKDVNPQTAMALIERVS